MCIDYFHFSGKPLTDQRLACELATMFAAGAVASSFENP